MARVSEEVAVLEFERWAEAFDLDVSGDGLEDGGEEDKALKAFKAKFVKRVQAGSLCVEDGGALEFAPRGGGESITFDEPTGAVLSARQKGDSDVQAARRVLAAWAGVPPKRFADMSLRDFNFCSELLAFFGNS